MKMKRDDFSLKGIATLFLALTVPVMTTAVLVGAFGAMTANGFFLKLHPYLFFTGFGNLAILVLNRYLTSAIYPELRIDPARQVRYIQAVFIALAMVCVAVFAGWPLLKTAAGLLLMIVVLFPLYEIVTTLSIPDIWKEVSVRYYIFDVIFLLNANLGLCTLGIKEAFPDSGLIPFFVTQSSYFLGSSFPLSISVMGFLYTYAWSRSGKRELARKLFSLWFYIFVGGVLIFLIVILAGNYLAMMLVSHFLLLGVITLLLSFSRYLLNFFRRQFAHPALGFLLGGLALLLATSAYGIFNIYFMKGIHFGSVPPIRADKMWIYHSHVHAALLGWITLSFIGMIYVVLPSIVRYGSLEALSSGNALESIMEKKTVDRAFAELVVLLLSATIILASLFFDNRIMMAAGGFFYAAALLHVMINLLGDKGYGTPDLTGEGQ